MARGYGQNLIEDEDGVIRPRVPQVIDARAPQADLSQNKPMSPNAPYELTAPGLTPKGIWDQMFKPKGLAGMVNASPLIQQPQQPAVSAFGAGLQQRQIPSLTTMANGGMNHQQKWMQLAVTPPASLNQFSTTPADADAIFRRYGSGTPKVTSASQPMNKDWKSQFSWASAFNR